VEAKKDGGAPTWMCFGLKGGGESHGQDLSTEKKAKPKAQSRSGDAEDVKEVNEKRLM